MSGFVDMLHYSNTVQTRLYVTAAVVINTCRTRVPRTLED